MAGYKYKNCSMQFLRNLGHNAFSSSLFPTLFGWESDQLISITTEVMISPDGKVFYHRKDAEKHWGQVGRDSSCECDMTMGTWDASWLSEERNLNCIVNTHVILTYISMPFRMSVYIIIDIYTYIAALYTHDMFMQPFIVAILFLHGSLIIQLRLHNN